MKAARSTTIKTSLTARQNEKQDTARSLSCTSYITAERDCRGPHGVSSQHMVRYVEIYALCLRCRCHISWRD